MRKMDLRITIFAIIMFMALEIDRSNIGQALADNLLVDLNITTDGRLLSSVPTCLGYLSMLGTDARRL